MLCVENLVHTRIGLSVKKPISFHVHPGTVLFVTGANGSGKSTLLRLVLGLKVPYHSTRITFYSEYAYLGNHNGLLSSARVRDYVRIHPSIPSYYHHQCIGHLSSGMQRRVALAHMMQQNKKLWIIDEPTVYLDAPAQDAFYQSLRAHSQQGGAALIATHDTIPNDLTDAQILNLNKF